MPESENFSLNLVPTGVVSVGFHILLGVRYIPRIDGGVDFTALASMNRMLPLEGKGRITGKGGMRTLSAGQLVYALPGGGISAPFTFQLREQTGASKLVRGFKRPLPSLSKYGKWDSGAEIEQWHRLIMLRQLTARCITKTSGVTIDTAVFPRKSFPLRVTITSAAHPSAAAICSASSKSFISIR